MKSIAKIGIAIIVLSVFFTSCKKDNNAPIVPEIESISFELQGDTAALWIIGFRDGDGDIGFKTDNNAVDNEALKLTLWGEGDTSYVAENSTGYVIDYIENVNPNRPLVGKIELDITGLDFIKQKYDSFYYEAYLLDRAGHKSNLIQSPLLEF